MVEGARTPEELDTLFEDAFVTRDETGFRALFDDGALLASRSGGHEACGGAAIGRAAARLWAGGGTYLAGPARVLQARSLALVIGDAGIHVARRGDDRAWRAAISLLDLVESTRREEA